MRRSKYLVFLVLLNASALTRPEPILAATTDPLPQLVRLLGDSRDAQFQLDILRGLSGAIRGRRSVPMPEGWSEVEPRLSGNPNAEIRALSLTLSLTFGSTNALETLKKSLMDQTADPETRRSALASLLTTRDASLPSILQGLLSDPSVRDHAIRALASFDDSRTPGAILAVYPSLGDGEKRDALNTLASRATYARVLMPSIKSGAVPRQALTAEVIRQLRNLNSSEINQLLAEVYGTVRESSGDTQKEIEKYKRLYRAGGSQPGNASRGRAVFDKVCAQCHTLFDAGGKVGPDLTGSNRGDLDYILQNILDPNAVIPNDYRASTIETKDGRSITGIVKQQDDKTVSVATQTDLLVLPRNEVQSVQQSELSMMPEGLLLPLQDQEVRDLIYYLGRTGQVPLPTGTQ